MGYETLEISVDGRGVATVTMNRAEAHNAMSAAMIADLARLAEDLPARDGLRAVVLTGAGKSFSAGADLRWMQAQMAADRATRMAEAGALAHALRALNELPLPLIGRINGQAYGGGMGLISVCDVAIGVEGAKFGFTEARLGLIPATISPYVLARMGEAAARRVFMSARIFGAEEAVALGLLARAVAPDALDAAVEAEVAPYLSAAPEAVARSKALARSLGPRIDEAVIAGTVARLADAWETPSAQEGIAAFFDKRRPVWPGQG